MQIASHMSEVLGRFLDRTSDALKITAGNMANIDTPHYKTQAPNFRSTFAGAMQDVSHARSELAAAPLESGSHARSELANAPLQTVPVDGLVSRPDGNNVSMDREGLQLAKLQLQFRAGVELLKHEYAGTMSAIHADGK